LELKVVVSGGVRLSGEAGAVLQKLRTYDIRLAVVVEDDTLLSSRFQQLLRQERRDGYFNLFDTRPKAIAWLTAAD
jgi:hypothetical protein